jgi:hypothetical protein
MPKGSTLVDVAIRLSFAFHTRELHECCQYKVPRTGRPFAFLWLKLLPSRSNWEIEEALVVLSEF